MDVTTRTTVRAIAWGVGVGLWALGFRVPAADKPEVCSGPKAKADTTQAGAGAVAEGSEDSVDSQVEKARVWHDKAVAGQREAVGLALAILEPLVESYPDNALARMLLGSCLTLKARDGGFPTSRLRWVRQGLAHMDAAVDQAPEDLELRFARASNNMELPAMFKRETVARTDWEVLWATVSGQERSGLADKILFRQQVALKYGEFLDRRGQRALAVSIWSIGRDWDSQSDVGKELDQRLMPL